MSRTQNVWNQPGEAVNERPFQVRSIPASMMAAASPARRVWPLRARSTRASMARPQSARFAGWSQSPSDIVDLSDGPERGRTPIVDRQAQGRAGSTVRIANVVRTAVRVMTGRHGRGGPGAGQAGEPARVGVSNSLTTTAIGARLQ